MALRYLNQAQEMLECWENADGNGLQELKLHMEGINNFADLLQNAATGLAKMFRRLRTSLNDLMNVFSNETYQP